MRLCVCLRVPLCVSLVMATSVSSCGQGAGEHQQLVRVCVPVCVRVLRDHGVRNDASASHMHVVANKHAEENSRHACLPDSAAGF